MTDRKIQFPTLEPLPFWETGKVRNQYWLMRLLSRINPNYNGVDHDYYEYETESASRRIAQKRAVKPAMEAYFESLALTGDKLYADISFTETGLKEYYCEEPCGGHSTYETVYVQTVRIAAYDQFVELAEHMNYYDDGYDECWGYSARFVTVTRA